MPLTKDQKLSILTKLNVDPSKYWMDDNGAILDLPEQGTAETALKSTLYNAPRTALGFGGGALGAAGAGLVGAPSGPGAIATGVAGSMAGSMAGSSIAQGLMDAVYPESWRLGQEAREARSPGTVFASDVLASTALMRPSPTVLKQAARIPGDLMRSGGQIQPQNLAAGLNIAIGSGLGAGQTLASGGSASDVLMQGAIGALQHQPTWLGRKASFEIFQPTSDTGPMPLTAARKAYADALAEQRLKQQTELADQNLANYPRTMQRMAEESNPLIERSADFVDPDAQERINAAVDILPLLAKTEQPPAAQPEVSPVTMAAAENVTPAESAKGEALRGASKIEQEQQMLPAPDLNDYLNAWADKFHTTVNEAAGLKDAAGREVGGVTTPRLTPGGETVTTINPKGYVDVRPHEALHSFLHDVLNFGSSGEQKMMRRILKELGAEPTKGSDGLWRVDPAAEEAIVQPAGEAVFRGIKDRKSVNAKDAMMDFMDYYLRNKVDKESALRMLSNRATFGSGAPSKVQKARMAGRPPTVEDRRDDLEEAASVAQERIAKQAEAEPATKQAGEPEVLPAEEGAQISPEEETPGYAPRLKSVKYETPEEPRVLTPEDVTPGSEVDRPEVIDYPGASIPQNVRRGRMERESARETPEDLEMRRIEARLAGEERPRYQPLDDSEFARSEYRWKFLDNLEERARKSAEAFEQAGLKVGDFMYTPRGTPIELKANSVTFDKRGEPHILGEAIDNEGGTYTGLFKLNQLSIDPPEGLDLDKARYQPLGPDRAEYKGAKLPEREQPFRGIFAGNVEALRRSGDPAKAKFADSAVELYARIRNYTGKYEDAVLPKFLRASPETRNKIVETLYEEDQKGEPLRSTLDPKEQEIYDQVRAGLKLMRTDQIAANHLVDGRPAKMDATYFPNTVDRSIIHDLTYNPTSARAQEAERQFIDYNVDRFVAKGMTQAQAQASAEKAFGKFVGSLKPMSIDSGFDFAAVSMPAGTKLPATWISADPVQGLRNYIRRFSRARAFHDVIGKDEDAMRAIGRKFYYGPNGQETQVTNPGSRIVRDPNVRALLENAIGVTHESQEGITPALGRLANTLLLSNVMSRLTDVATTPFKALTYLPPQHIPGLLANMRNIRQSIQNAYKTGGARRGDMLVMRDVLGAGDVAINKIDKLSEYITKYTGSEAIEKGSRMLAQNVGEYVYDVNKRLADSGDKRALAFFERLTPKWRTLDRIEVSQRIAQLFQGSYDATNLPIWIQNSPAAPFFSMMKWNVEQWNNFKRHAIEPARNGDIVPLVSTILGGIVGGMAVGELREALSGKKQRVASFNELAYGFSQGDKTRAATEATRKLAFLAQVTGTLGVIGELGLQGVDIMAKDKPQGFSWPAFDLASDVLGKAQNAVAAIVDRPQDAGTITTAVVHDLARDVFSQYRLASAAADKLRGSGETIEANRRRDLRMSEKLRGEPTRFSPMVQADYKNAKEHAFDRTRDMGKAKELARELRSTAREEARTGDEYKAAMRKLGTSRISGIPSRENSPQQYVAHLKYVRATQGDKAAQELAQEYGRLRAEQQMKASLFK